MTTTDLRSWLQTLADAQATIPAAEVLKRLPVGEDNLSQVPGDLTLDQVATEVHRAVSTVRTWCNGGRLQGAYRLNGRDWRIPQAALRKFLDRQGRGEARNEVPHGEGDWDDWKREGTGPS